MLKEEEEFIVIHEEPSTNLYSLLVLYMRSFLHEEVHEETLLVCTTIT